MVGLAKGCPRGAVIRTRQLSALIIPNFTYQQTHYPLPASPSAPPGLGEACEMQQWWSLLGTSIMGLCPQLGLCQPVAVASFPGKTLGTKAQQPQRAAGSNCSAERSFT